MAFEVFVTGLLSPFMVLLLIKAVHSYFRASKPPLPPKPNILPLVGELLALTGDVKSDCKIYHKWCKELNTDIIYLNILGSRMMILDTYEASKELLDKRSAINSGRTLIQLRPKMPMLTGLMGWDFHFALMDYGNTWRQHRKVMHQAFTASAVKDFRPQQIKAARGLIKRLLSVPEDTVDEIRLMSGEIILSTTYGINVKSVDDRYIRLAEEGIDPLNQALIPGTFLVDTFPLLKYVPAWFPGAGFKRKAREWRRAARGMVDIPFEDTKAAIKKGTANASFVTKCLDGISGGTSEGMNAEEEIVKSVAGTMYQTGSETTAVGLATGILALLENPNVLKKAQQEIDSVVLPGNFPTFGDQESLPYMTAIVKEILRYQAIAPIGVPHTTISDDVYNGYHIPAGTILMSNIWAILHDEKVFPDPEAFIPERFMVNDEVAEARLEVAWGYGRRICVGRYMAFSTIWIALASIIAVYDISKPIDDDGNIVHPSHEYTSTSILPFPLPFKAVFKPRNEVAEALIRSGFDDVQAS
ncbi:cytochrome P450 [Cyathus striatus]|nr:cytochrome P450 [Cyathus striatus]